MKKPTYHILVCNSFRVSGEPQGFCNRRGAPGFLAFLEEAVIDRGLDAMVSATGCLKVCDRGPALVVYPNNWWYGDMNEEKIEEVLDALEDGRAVEDYLIA